MSAPIAHGGGITEAAARFGGAPDDWLDLSTGINPCPVALPKIDARVWHRLPDRHLEETGARGGARLLQDRRSYAAAGARNPGRHSVAAAAC
ncbi:histidinol-phosphate/aromatic aminotransferase/cobyric acid decarboxylase-like protein [Sinorhizobium fredii]